MRWRRLVRKYERAGLCLERDGPSYVEGSGIWGFGSSRTWTRNRGLGVGIPLGRSGFDIFGVEGGGRGFAGSGDLRAQLIVLGMGYSGQVVGFHYGALIVEGDLELELE